MNSMYAKLFSRIAQSSLMEQDVETRYCFMMLLAIADIEGDIIGTDVAIARSINLPLETFRASIESLMAPDPDSNSQVLEGRRVVKSDNGRGYRIVNYKEYRAIKTTEEKRAYMRDYMRERRKSLSGKDVTAVKICKNVLSDVTHAEAEAEEDSDSKAKTNPSPKPAAGKGAGDRLPTSETAKRIATIFKRRHTTAWSEKEIAAFKALGEIDLDDLTLLERYYASPAPYLRHDLGTFLNNFAGEIDRAKKLPPEKQAQAAHTAPLGKWGV
jgi:hypothetical protein